MPNEILRIPSNVIPTKCKDFDDFRSQLLAVGLFRKGFGLMIYDTPNPAFSSESDPNKVSPTIPYLVFAPINKEGVHDTSNIVGIELLPCPPLCPDRNEGSFIFTAILPSE